MNLAHGLHLAYCTNVHRGEDWAETFAGLNDYTLRVKEQVSPDAPYAIGLRLGQRAAMELSEANSGRLDAFRRWLDKNGCYVFTINGFPFGKFHGERVKEQVYRPDWTSVERLEYTNLLFDIVANLVPEGIAGSVSTLPGSFKEFITDDGAQGDAIVDNLAACGRHVADLCERTGKDLHLGLEPEPLGWFETSGETVAFFDRFRARIGDQYDKLLGVNYDTCHLAVEFEGAAAAIEALRYAQIRISKLHLSSALKVNPDAAGLERLRAFQEDVYLHQVVERLGDGQLRRHRDLPDALADAAANPGAIGEEWRVHFHVPLHEAPAGGLGDTRDHLTDVFDLLAEDPALCEHLEMETYTWEVLPSELHSGDVVEQLVREYQWTLRELRNRKLA
jgi:sugar phosphate isomerase/epimerase